MNLIIFLIIIFAATIVAAHIQANIEHRRFVRFLQATEEAERKAKAMIREFESGNSSFTIKQSTIFDKYEKDFKASGLGEISEK